MATKTVTLLDGNVLQNLTGGSGPLCDNPMYSAATNKAFQEPPKVQGDQAASATSGSAGNGKYLGVSFSAYVHVFPDTADGAADYAQFSQSAVLRGVLPAVDWSVA